MNRPKGSAATGTPDARMSSTCGSSSKTSSDASSATPAQPGPSSPIATNRPRVTGVSRSRAGIAAIPRTPNVTSVGQPDFRKRDAQAKNNGGGGGGRPAGGGGAAGAAGGARAGGT